MIKIKPIKQKSGWCGAACFKMVMDYYGVKKSQDEWARLTAFRYDKNGRIESTDERKFYKVVRKLGFKAYSKNHASIKDIQSYLKKDIPVMVIWFHPVQGSHFSVVVDLTKDKIVLADPYDGKIHRHDIETFKDRWFNHMPFPIKSLRQFDWVRRMCVAYPKDR